MKTNFKLQLIFLFGLIFFSLQSVKEMDYCERQFYQNVDNANKEYQSDLTRCNGAKLSHLCFAEAALNYEKQVSGAYSTFNSCFNLGKE